MEGQLQVTDAVTGRADERVVLHPGERRQAVLEVIRSARGQLLLSLFRCDDFKVLDELADAVHRGVKVEVLMSRRAKGWDERLTELANYLVGMGATVHRFADPVIKYHAKYVLADDGPALLASLNLTRKCFDKTVDFMLVTHDAAVVSGIRTLFRTDCQGLTYGLPEGVSERLIVGPERARRQLTDLLSQARRQIRIIDHKIADPAIATLLKLRQSEGVDVEVLGSGSYDGLMPHGKMILVDGALAAIGSIALSAQCMDFRREVAVLVDDPRIVGELQRYFQGLSAGPRSAPRGGVQ